MTWIRVETNVAENDKVIALAEGCGISVESALGFLIRFWGRVAEHRPDGDLSHMSDSALERWAGWNGMPMVFSETLRKLFVRNDILEGWIERQGKLAQRAAADRARKHPRKFHGNSTATKTKTIRSSSSSKEETVSTEIPRKVSGNLAYYRACTVALNTGMSANTTVEGGWIPVVASSQVGRVTWCEDGIPLEVAEQVILDRCQSYHSTSQNRGPRSLKYFDAAIRETWERGKESEATADVTRALA